MMMTMLLMSVEGDAAANDVGSAGTVSIAAMVICRV